MKNKTAREILNDTPQEIRNEVSKVAHQEILLEKLKEVLTKFNVRHHLNINDWGYSEVEREIVNTLLSETYTREEVYTIAERSIHAVINNILTENTEKPITQVINSEIDTVKLF